MQFKIEFVIIYMANILLLLTLILGSEILLKTYIGKESINTALIEDDDGKLVN